MKRGFVPISLKRYVKLHMRANPGKDREDLVHRLRGAMDADARGVLCRCGNRIWIIGSAEVGLSCAELLDIAAMALADRHVTALRKRAKKGFRGYPVATIAYYGPDDRRATKVAVGIVLSESRDVAHMERWFSDTTDVRTDPQINEAIVQYIQRHAVRSVGMFGRITGCPHEEGIDYPEGEKYPRCPFWAGRDRWSGEEVQ